MKRALAALLICAALALLALWAWGRREPAGNSNSVAPVAKPEMCRIGSFCATQAPPPVELRPGEAALGPGHRDHSIVQAAIGETGRGTIYPYEPTRRAAPDPVREVESGRLYLARLRAGGEALVIVRDVAAQRRALLIRRGTSFAGYRLSTDFDLSLRRFALLDPATGVGDTFELRQAGREDMFSYVALAPDSPEIRAQWFESKRSTCGDGPLTAPRPEWEQEYRRVCGP